MRSWLERNFKTIIITTFLIPIIIVAIVSISHVTQWYEITNPPTWALYLSIGIEVAALSALAALSIRMGSKVYFPFLVVTLLQLIGNVYFSYSYIDIDSEKFKSWVELSSPLMEMIGTEPTDIISHKRILAFFSGGMLPLISLSFLHMLVKYNDKEEKTTIPEPSITELFESRPLEPLKEEVVSDEERYEDLFFEDEDERDDEPYNLDDEHIDPPIPTTTTPKTQNYNSFKEDTYEPIKLTDEQVNESEQLLNEPTKYTYDDLVEDIPIELEEDYKELIEDISGTKEDLGSEGNIKQSRYSKYTFGNR